MSSKASPKAVGTNAEVFLGYAKKTATGKTKRDLAVTSSGKVRAKPKKVSKPKSKPKAPRKKNSKTGGVVSKLPYHNSSVPHPIQVSGGVVSKLPYHNSSVPHPVQVSGDGIEEAIKLAIKEKFGDGVMGAGFVDFVKRVAGIVRTVAKELTSGQYFKLAQVVLDLLVATGEPRVKIFAMTAKQLLPFVEQALKIVAGKGFVAQVGSGFVAGTGFRLP